MRLSTINKQSRLTISGTDSDWVTARFTQIKELIDTVKIQESWFIDNIKLITHVAAICFGHIALSIATPILELFITPIENPSESLQITRVFFSNNPLMKGLLYLLLIWISGMSFSLIFRDWLLKLWPKIEFDFGPEHLKIIKLRRIRIYQACTIVIIPVLISFLINFI